MAQHDSERPPAASASRGEKTVARTTRATKTGHAVPENTGVKQPGPMTRIARQTTLRTDSKPRPREVTAERIRGPGWMR